MTSLVSSMPSATMARLSPTSTMSMPAASATWALGKSCAVIMVMGSPRRCSVRSVPMVTFLRGFADGVPMGECELCRTCRGAVAATGPRNPGRMLEGRALRRREEAHDRSRGVAAVRDMGCGGFGGVDWLHVMRLASIHRGQVSQGGTRKIGGGDDGGR